MKDLETKPYFSEAALKFLRDLSRNNRREWFNPRKPAFERELRQPMLAMIGVVTDAMAEFAPAHVRPPQKCMMRIYRDTRFSSDKRPYKGQVAAWWSREGMEKISGAGYYMHVSPKEVVIAAGVYMPVREQLLAIRRFLLENHSRVRMLLEDKRLRKVMASFDGAASQPGAEGISEGTSGDGSAALPAMGRGGDSRPGSCLEAGVRPGGDQALSVGRSARRRAQHAADWPPAGQAPAALWLGVAKTALPPNAAQNG